MPQIDFRQLMDSARISAVHLEMRDTYGVGDEADDFERWRATGDRDVDPGSAYWTPWVELISRARARGVRVRRARVVSEPVTEYIRYEHAGTPVNLFSGEEVRWLPRRLAATLLLPGADLWVFDGRTVLFNHFTGNGEWADPGMELRTEADVVEGCVHAFEEVWERAVPHDEYKIR
ncbi:MULTISPECIES: DUF6879 family protein [Streptomyces]|uniref:DUF6879 family protein n=1 Tax=Streptomyces TaxID=1883 RepID=UPI0001DEDD52|nr:MULTISPECIES: DUF6879 family protein [unclassified Streptomyces]EFL02070.1 conserved hypothetical protein [Streptomyces sp. SPB78]MDT0421361.1 hypothetical protein [Streptomyces sp. DSM 41859]WEH29308.1 hypothetical protein P0D76_19375 [Streptomyces sp. AM 3-1-1]